MSAPISTDLPHVHYCKDLSSTICLKRGYCLCVCGARASHPRIAEDATGEWKEPIDLMAALKSSLADSKEAAK